MAPPVAHLLSADTNFEIYLDQKNNDGGAQLNATWANPLIYVPTEMK